MLNDDNKQSRNVRIPVNYANLSKMNVRDLKRGIRYRYFVPNYNKDDLRRFMDAPDKYERPLRYLSVYLYNKDLHYKRVVNYFATMPLYSHILEPHGIDPKSANPKTLLGQYKKTADFLDVMNIPHEFQKLSFTVWKEDVYYGYEIRVKDSCFFLKLNADYCVITSIEDGVYNFSFDFTYFDQYPYELEFFPQEFAEKYQKYMTQGTYEYRWQELEGNTICIKANEEIDYPVPPFAGIFESLYDVEDFKALRQTQEEIKNYAILAQELPMKKDSEDVNDFLIDLDTMTTFHNKAAESLPEQVGLITSPMPIKAFTFDKDSPDFDSVAKAERDLYNLWGISQNLFNTDSKNVMATQYSIQTDEQMVFGLLRQLERWLNKRIKKEPSLKNVPFRVKMLDVTRFSQEDMFNQMIEASTYGFSTKTMAGAITGLSPAAMMNMHFLENEVLNLPDQMIPLSSSHTQNGDETLPPSKKNGGRPMKKTEDLSTSGENSRDNGKVKGKTKKAGNTS